MADSDVREALFIEVNNFLEANGFEGAIKWENSVFDPSGKQNWAAVFYIPNQPFLVTLGSGGYDRLTGFVQVDVNIAQGKGFTDMDNVMNAARVEFVAGKSYSYNGAKAIIINAGESQGTMVDNWYRKSITIAFRADLPRATI